jgi:hypothetical protein
LQVGRGSQDVLTYHNTVYGNTVGLAAAGDLGNSGPYQNNTFKNNLSTGNVTNFRAVGGGENDGTNGSGNVYTYNGFGPEASNFIEWAYDTFKSTYADFATAYGSATNSLTSDPLFTNAAAGDFTLQAGSPAIGAGVYIAGVSTANPPNVGAK